ncbi:hypothetical protein, partial [Pseudomonas fluorescens]
AAIHIGYVRGGALVDGVLERHLQCADLRQPRRHLRPRL